MLNSRGPNPPTMVLPQLTLRSPLLKPFLSRCLNGDLTTADGREEGDFSPIDQRCFHATSVPVQGHRQTERDPLLQPEFNHEVSDGAAGLDRSFVMASTELFPDLSKSDDGDGHAGILGGHATPYGQGFMNTIPHRPSCHRPSKPANFGNSTRPANPRSKPFVVWTSA